MVAEGYKDTEIGVIPIEWDVVKLNSVLTIKRGASPRPINEFITENEDGINWIKIGDIKEGSKYIIQTKQKITQDGAKKSREIKPKDFVLSNSMSFGRPYISKIYGCIHDGWLLLRNTDENILSNNFLYEVFSGDFSKKQFKKFAAGSTVNNLKSETVSELKIPLPPLKEQERIADILSTADAKIDAITSQIKKTETLKKGLLQKLLSEGIGHSEFKDSELGKIPTSWEVVKIVKVLDLMTDYVANGSFASLKENTTVYDNIEYAYYVRLFDLRRGLGHNAQKYVDEATYNFLDKSFLEGDEILIANIGANVGESFLMPKVNIPATLAPNMIELKLNYEKMIPIFCFFYLTSHIGLSELDKVIEGSGQPKINKTKLKTIKIPLPPLEEQKQIAEILSTTDKKLEVLRAKKEKYETLKKGLLQKLLSGEVRVLKMKEKKELLHKVSKSSKQDVIGDGTVSDFYDSFDVSCKELKEILDNPKKAEELQTIEEFLDEL